MFRTTCNKEQQTRDNLIVKDYCFIIEIFDKFSFSGILRGCLSHLERISISQTTGSSAVKRGRDYGKSAN